MTSAGRGFRSRVHQLNGLRFKQIVSQTAANPQLCSKGKRTWKNRSLSIHAGVVCMHILGGTSLSIVEDSMVCKAADSGSAAALFTFFILAVTSLTIVMSSVLFFACKAYISRTALKMLTTKASTVLSTCVPCGESMHHTAFP